MKMRYLGSESIDDSGRLSCVFSMAAHLRVGHNDCAHVVFYSGTYCLLMLSFDVYFFLAVHFFVNTAYFLNTSFPVVSIHHQTAITKDLPYQAHTRQEAEAKSPSSTMDSSSHR